MGKASRRKRDSPFRHFRDPQGRKVIPLDPESVDILEKLGAEFEQKFGRKPGPDDPVFFDPNSDTPQPMDPRKLTDDLSFAMVRAGIRPALVYAFQKTGLMVTEENEVNLLPKDLAAWNAAIDEFERIQKGEQQ